MKNKLFDDHVKEQLGNYRPDVPSHIWENIAAKTGKRKPVGYWAWGPVRAVVILTFLFILSLSAYFFTHKNLSIATPAFIAKNTQSEKNISLSPTNAITLSPATTQADAENTIPVYSTSQNKESSLTPDYTSAHQIKSNRSGRFAFSVNNALPETEEEALHLNKQEQNYFLTPLYMNLALHTSASSREHKLQMPLLPKAAAVPCPGKNMPGAKKYVEIYAGPDYAFNTFSDTANSVYMLQRKAASSPLIAYSAGIRFTKVYSSGLSVRTGINYSGVNEQFRAVNGQVTRNVYITNVGGDTIGTSTVTGTQYKVSTNKYRSIDIPLVVGYELGNGRLHANVNAGALVNIHSRYTGYVADNNGNPVDISSGKSASVYSYKTNAGISLTGGLSVYYQLNNKLHVLAEPYIKYGLSSVTKPDLTLKEKRHAAGFRVGLRMDL